MFNQIFISLLLLSLPSLAQSPEVPLCNADQMKICNGCASSAPYCCASGIAKRGCSANPTTWEKSKACSLQCKIAPVVKTPVAPKIEKPKITPVIDVPKVDPVEEPKVEPVKEPVIQNSEAFPADGESLSIQFKNSTEIPIIVWLDNQAFCPKKSSVADCKQGDNSAWDRNLGKFFIYTKKDGQWVREPGKSGRKQTIEPGQVWRIMPPLDENNRPYWCFDQPAGGDKWKRNCPGVGAWVTPAGITMNAIEKVTRFEYNINGNEIWFNQSAVDGSNVNATTEYTGNCPDNKRVCELDLKSCPVMDKADGALTCFSPKFWKDLDECGTNGFGAKWKLSPRDLAGCGYGDREHKIECHKWWATNEKCAQKWLKYLQGDGKCQTYGWAYDEMRWDKSQGDNFDFNGNPQTNKAVHPLINCPLKAGSLNVQVTDILH